MRCFSRTFGDPGIACVCKQSIQLFSIILVFGNAVSEVCASFFVVAPGLPVCWWVESRRSEVLSTMPPTYCGKVFTREIHTTIREMVQ